MPRPPRTWGRLAMLLTLCTTLAALLALGTWQVQRLGWKRALIAQVDSRIHAEPVAVPPPAAWPALDTTGEAYRHVRLSGHWRVAQRLFVYAATERGAGYWVMTPLQLADDPRAVVWVNQGYVTNEQKHRLAGAPAVDRVEAVKDVVQETVQVTGLLRPSEPDHAWMRQNVPTENRWYVRSVEQMSQATDLAAPGWSSAPFFVDADAGQTSGIAAQDATVGGLTTVRFSNNHLVYALTWYGLALLNLGVLIFLLRTEWLPRATARPLAA